MDKNVNLDEYLKEALLSQQNRIAIALLLFEWRETKLMATQLEDIHFHSQAVIDVYCKGEDTFG